MEKRLKQFLKVVAFILLGFFLYIAAHLIYSTVYDYQPDEEILLSSINTNSIKSINKDTLTFISWNFGYGGIGKESYMFYDMKRTFTSGGYKVTTDKEYIEKNVAGIKGFVQKNPADFYLFQEIDTASTRSYFINEFREISEVLPLYTSTFATNYQVDRVPLPLLEPWNVLGSVRAGLASYSKYQPEESKRLKLPGEFSWPTRVFHLDRCLLVQRYKTEDKKELVVINLHNSAYDEDGFMKKGQLGFLKNLVLSEYDLGNYVIVGGDWNMSPPESDLEHLYDDGTAGKEYLQDVKNFLPEEWKWVYDSRYTTSRKAGMVYKAKETPEKLIDYFLLSPNVTLLQVETLKRDFEYSDHEAVRIEVVLDN